MFFGTVFILTRFCTILQKAIQFSIQVSRRWFTEADVKDFKSSALRTTTEMAKTGSN